MAPPITNGGAHVTKPGTPATAGASAEGDAATFWSRFEHVKYGDLMKNVLIEDVITRYESLLREHREYVKQHDEEREYAKTSMEREQMLQSGIERMQRIMNRDPYIMVLIDGDGTIFNSDLLKQGAAGGKLAATILHKHISEWATKHVVDYPADCKVVVRIFANVKGLADVCTRVGIVDTATKIEDFARGFNCGKPLFDFIDVAAGKDRVEGKINETFKLYVYNYHCRQVIFGCSHDNGYARLLEQYMYDEEALSRVTLLEGTPFEKDLDSLPFPHAKFNGVFRNQKINAGGQMDVLTGYPPHRVDSGRGLNAASDVFTPGTATPTSMFSPMGTAASLDGQSMAGRNLHLRDDSVASSGNSSDTGGNTWATVTSKNKHKPLTAGVTRAAPEVKEGIQRNKFGQRLDRALEYDREQVQKIKPLKACNQHYIGVGCCHFNAGREDKCPHDHRIKFTPESLKVLRVVARETPCKKGHGCDDAKCIYGHHCPFPVASEGSMRGSGCLNGETCRFPRSMHGMDTTAVKATRIVGGF